MADHPSSDSTLLTFDGIIYMMFRRKWLLLLGALLGIAGAVSVHLNSAPVFMSEAKLLVRYVTDNMRLDPATADGRVMSPDTRGSNILNSEIEILTSQDLISEIVEAVGPDRIILPQPGQPSNSEFAAQIVLSGLEVGVPLNTNIIKLRYRTAEPDLAKEILDELVKGYLEKHRRIHMAAGSYEFFSKHTDQLRSALAVTEEELRELKNKHGVVVMEESKGRLSARLDNLQEKLQEETVEHAASRVRVQLLEAELGVVSNATDSEKTPVEQPRENRDYLREKEGLQDLYAEEVRLLRHYTRQSKPVLRIRMLIEEAKRRLAAQTPPGVVYSTPDSPTSTLGTDLFSERAALASFESRIEVLKTQIENTQKEIQDLNDGETRIVELERRKELQESRYVYFSESLEKAKIDVALEAEVLSNINVVQPATVPIRSVPQGKIKKMALAMIVGLGVGAGLAFLLEFIGGRALRRPIEVERMLDIPTLISLPRNVDIRQLVSANGTGPAKLLTSGMEDSPPYEPKDRHLSSFAGGYFDALSYRIEMTGVLSGDIPHMIGIASCAEGAGATTIATGLAMAMSKQEDEKVLLIETGESGNSAHSMLGVEAKCTLSDILEGDGTNESFKVQDGLYVISARNGAQPMSQISLGRRFRDLVSYLKDGKYTTVIVDLPPIKETSPTLQLASLLDGVVVVLEQEKVSLQQGRRALELLEQSSANVIGTVFNKMRDVVPTWLDGSG